MRRSLNGLKSLARGRGRRASTLDLSNNSQTETTVVVAPTEADVSINLPDSAVGYAGQNIWLGIEVGNAGPAPATGVTVTLVFPPGLSQSYGGGVCTDTGSRLSCVYSLESLTAGGGMVDLIGVTASAGEFHTAQGSVIPTSLTRCCQTTPIRPWSPQPQPPTCPCRLPSRPTRPRRVLPSPTP